MTSTSQGPTTYELLPKSKGGSQTFKEVKSSDGKPCLEYSVDFAIPNSVENKDIDYIKSVITQYLHFADYWTNIGKSPRELQNFYYSVKLGNWITVCSFFSTYYFFNYLRNKRQYGFLVSAISTLTFMFLCNIGGNVWNGVSQINYLTYIGNDVLHNNDKDEINRFIEFHNSLRSKLDNSPKELNKV